MWKCSRAIFKLSPIEQMAFNIVSALNSHTQRSLHTPLQDKFENISSCKWKHNIWGYVTKPALRKLTNHRTYLWIRKYYFCVQQFLTCSQVSVHFSQGKKRIMYQTNPSSMPRKAEVCDMNKLFRINEFILAVSLSVLPLVFLSTKQAWKWPLTDTLVVSDYLKCPHPKCIKYPCDN